ncbi:putative UDP-glucuronosyl/UDP-glucosyltransferase [Helianthus annuus]|uniref:UDP-glucuronosyl/UDP-glucosyltransferase n=1 Tax=Helianthus annuus TaxID=4232 RepID=A0A251SPI3_HELAN|nr:putative UDP-glucuronosyl/UDP-glucosyltransferase [Helianthus annuus]KAJ0550371.1 putative UDP-glucuronosyl/UDP-glucosyltransferase [Helianthus annuus]KAJ0557077.1 putative UDP-glucuronosyl/UDP-glucosyltransferase [Helianthus annuus]KAJ0563327.1 putative UDP-glucuronosyl/UDP-glucosyltransferase [Helianthus annuus]KAJ0731425.1 putative UDP-glucuronosyl/UDP-glucosyltransferase [Helianthus annuus]
MGHAGQLVARHMVKTFDHITATVLVIKLPGDEIGTDYTNSFTDHIQINFIHFPPMDLHLFQQCPTLGFRVDAVINHHKPIIRDLVASASTGPGPMGALIVDMFCTTIIDVAKEFNLPAYVFFTSNAAFLGTMFHFQTLQDELGQDISELSHSPTELQVPSYANPVPPSVVPNVLLDRDQWSKRFLCYARKYREANGIIVNTFQELEHHALRWYDGNTPPVYTVGPLIKPKKPTPDHEVLQWLKGQPESSVLLLCFGSRGWFGVDQVRGIAVAIERSGCRFIWSLRRASPEELNGFPDEYADYNEVLPDGFLERTAEKGKVVGWVPQAEVLVDMATGGFCVALWVELVTGEYLVRVPVATWPIYAEQQLDAFQMVKDLGLAVEISLDYNQMNKDQQLVSAETIEKGIREVMDRNSAVRAKVKEMSAKSRMAMEEGGSSFESLRRLVDDIM